MRLGRPPDQRGLGPGPPEDRQRRQALDGVEEVPAEPVQQAPLLPVWSCACQPTSAMKTGISGRVNAMISAESQSASTTTSQHGDRHERGEHQLRQVPRDVVVERVEPARGQRGELAGIQRRRIGPAPVTCATSRRRSCDLTAAALRSAAVSAP